MCRDLRFHDSERSTAVCPGRLGACGCLAGARLNSRAARVLELQRRPRAPAAVASPTDGDVQDFVAIRQTPAFLTARFQAQRNRLLDLLQGLSSVPALADTARNQRALRHAPAILTSVQKHRQPLANRVHEPHCSPAAAPTGVSGSQAQPSDSRREGLYAQEKNTGTNNKFIC